MTDLEARDTRTTVLIVDDSPAIVNLLSRFILSAQDMVLVGVASTGQDALRRAAELEPDVVLLDLNLPDADGIQVAGAIADRVPHSCIIVITAEESTRAMQKAILAGAQGYLTKPVQSEMLLQTIRDVRARHVGRISRIMETGRLEAEPPAPGEGATRGSGDRRGRRVTVFCPKGGRGSTVIAVNLALVLAGQSQKSVVLVDADFAVGDVCVHLDLVPKMTIIDLLPRLPDMDTSLLDGILVAHPSGLKVLAPPALPEQVEMITVDHLRRLYINLPRFFDYVVVDCEHGYRDAALAALDHSDLILLVLTPEVGPIRHGKMFLRLAESLGYGRERIVAVLNRADSGVGIGVVEAQEVLGLPRVLPLPSAGKAIVSSINNGRPMVLDNPKHAWSKAMRAIAEQVEARLAQRA